MANFHPCHSWILILRNYHAVFPFLQMDVKPKGRKHFVGWIVAICAIAISIAIFTIPTVVFYVYRDSGAANWRATMSDVVSHLSSCSNQTLPTTLVRVPFGFGSFSLHCTIISKCSNCLTGSSNQSVHEQNVCSLRGKWSLLFKSTGGSESRRTCNKEHYYKHAGKKSSSTGGIYTSHRV